MAKLFDVQRPAITKHLANIFNDGELEKNSVCAKFAHTAEDGKKYQTDYYNYDRIKEKLKELLPINYRFNPPSN